MVLLLEENIGCCPDITIKIKTTKYLLCGFMEYYITQKLIDDGYIEGNITDVINNSNSNSNKSNFENLYKLLRDIDITGFKSDTYDWDNILIENCQNVEEFIDKLKDDDKDSKIAFKYFCDKKFGEYFGEVIKSNFGKKNTRRFGNKQFSDLPRVIDDKTIDELTKMITKANKSLKIAIKNAKEMGVIPKYNDNDNVGPIIKIKIINDLIKNSNISDIQKTQINELNAKLGKPSEIIKKISYNDATNMIKNLTSEIETNIRQLCDPFNKILSVDNYTENNFNELIKLCDYYDKLDYDDKNKFINVKDIEEIRNIKNKIEEENNPEKIFNSKVKSLIDKITQINTELKSFDEKQNKTIKQDINDLELDKLIKNLNSLSKDSKKNEINNMLQQTDIENIEKKYKEIKFKIENLDFFRVYNQDKVIKHLKDIKEEIIKNESKKYLVGSKYDDNNGKIKYGNSEIYNIDELYTKFVDSKTNEERNKYKKFIMIIKDDFENLHGISKVYVKSRPFITDSVDSSIKIVNQIDDYDVKVDSCNKFDGNFGTFNNLINNFGPFDKIFVEKNRNSTFIPKDTAPTSNKNVYGSSDDISSINSVINNVLELGQNALFLSFGSSGSGKTYSLFSSIDKFKNDPIEPGIVHYILNTLRERYIKEVEMTSFQLYLGDIYKCDSINKKFIYKYEGVDKIPVEQIPGVDYITVNKNTLESVNEYIKFNNSFNYINFIDYLKTNFNSDSLDKTNKTEFQNFMRDLAIKVYDFNKNNNKEQNISKYKINAAVKLGINPDEDNNIKTILNFILKDDNYEVSDISIKDDDKSNIKNKLKQIMDLVSYKEIFSKPFDLKDLSKVNIDNLIYESVDIKDNIFIQDENLGDTIRLTQTLTPN